MASNQGRSTSHPHVGNKWVFEPCVVRFSCVAKAFLQTNPKKWTCHDRKNLHSVFLPNPQRNVRPWHQPCNFESVALQATQQIITKWSCCDAKDLYSPFLPSRQHDLRPTLQTLQLKTHTLQDTYPRNQLKNHSEVAQIMLMPEWSNFMQRYQMVSDDC